MKNITINISKQEYYQLSLEVRLSQLRSLSSTDFFCASQAIIWNRLEFPFIPDEPPIETYHYLIPARFEIVEIDKKWDTMKDNIFMS